MALNITQEQYNIAKAYADSGDYKGGWNYLASVGDNYADNAYAVTSGNATGWDVPFAILVPIHWENTAPGAFADKFDQVATQHFQQYVKNINDNGLSLPFKPQIEESYRKAVEDAGLPPEVAFGGVFTRSIGELYQSQ